MKKILSIVLVVALLPLTTLTALASTIKVVISNDGPSSSDVSIDSSDVILQRMTVTTDGDIMVDNLVFTVNANGEGLLNDDGSANFTDFKVVEIDDSGAVEDTLMGPMELNLFGSDSSQTLNFTDNWALDGRTSMRIAITCDIENNASLDGSQIWTNFEPVSTTSGILDITSEDIDYVSDITPSVPIYGYVMTVVAPTSLNVSLSSTPTSDTVVGGIDGLNVVSFALTAGDSSDATVTRLTLAGYIDENGDSDYNQGVDNGVYLRDVVTSVWLENADGDVVAGPEMLSSDGDATFSSMSWDIPAGDTELLKVYVNVSSSAPYNLDDDAFHFDIDDASSDVVAEDIDGNSIVVSGDDANGDEDSPRVAMTVADVGTLTLARNLGSGLDDQIMAAGGEDVFVGSFKIAATDEDFEIDTMTITVNEYDAIQYLTIEYPTDVEYPSDLDGSQTVAMSSSSALFTDVSAIVPADNYIVVNLYVDLADHNRDGGTLDSGDALIFYLNTTGYDFEAIGLDSGVVLDETGVFVDVTTQTDTTYVYRSVPTFAVSTSFGGSLGFGEDQEVYRFSVSADENGRVVLGSVTFDIVATGVIISSGSFYITEYGSSTVIGYGRYTTDGIVMIRLGLLGSVISAGSTKTYSVYADVYDSSPDVDDESIAIGIHQDFYLPVGTFSGVRTALGGYGTIWSDYGMTRRGIHGPFATEWMGNYQAEGVVGSHTTL